MASKVALAKRAERDRQELFDRLDRLERKVDQMFEAITGAAKTAPAKRASRQKRTGTDA